MTRRLALSLALATLALAAVLVPSASAKVKFFQSPSGNIGCVVGGGLARCDIQQHTWPTPPKPEGCPVDYGNGVAVIGGHRGDYTCAGDTVFSPDARVLGYGEKITKNRFTCTSMTSGMRCANRNSGHGFFLSRDVVRLF